MIRKAVNSSLVLKTIVDSFRFLTTQELWHSFGLSFLTAVGEIFQIASLLSLMPFINLIIYENTLQKSTIINNIWVLLGQPEHSLMVMIFAGLTCSLIIGSFIINYLIIVWGEKFTVTSQQRLAQTIFRSILNAPYSWFLTRNTSTIVRLIYNDIGIWNRDIIRAVIRMAALVPLLIVSVAVVLLTAPEATLLIGFSAVTILFILMRSIRPKQLQWTHAKRLSCDEVVVTATDIIGGIKDVKVTGKSEIFSHSFEKQYHKMNKANSLLLIISNFPGMLLNALGQISLVIVAYTLWLNIGSSQDVFNKITALVLITSRIIPALSNLSGSLSRIINVIPWITSLSDLINEISMLPSSPSNNDTSSQLPAITHVERVDLDNIFFSYGTDNSVVLAGLNLKMKRGCHYGIVGKSGAGKSTLVDIIIGLQEPNSGRILIDGTPLDEIDHGAWCRSIGYVPQNPSFTDDTIRANIIFGNIEDEELLNKSIHDAGLSDFINELPEGIDTRLGDQGIRASGGQRQRISIARSLYKQPVILLLDEATASLDT